MRLATLKTVWLLSPKAQVQLQVIPVDNQGQLSEAFNARIDELKVLDIQFLPGSEGGAVVAVLYQDAKGARHVKSYEIDAPRKVSGTSTCNPELVVNTVTSLVNNSKQCLEKGRTFAHACVGCGGSGSADLALVMPQPAVEQSACTRLRIHVHAAKYFMTTY